MVELGFFEKFLEDSGFAKSLTDKTAPGERHVAFIQVSALAKSQAASARARGWAETAELLEFVASLSILESK